MEMVWDTSKVFFRGIAIKQNAFRNAKNNLKNQRDTPKIENRRSILPVTIQQGNQTKNKKLPT